MLELYLIRHPPTLATVSGILQGQRDTVLVPDWKNKPETQQVLDTLDMVLKRRGHFDLVLSSDLQRAVEPRRYVEDYLVKKQQPPFETASKTNLRERDWGELENKTLKDIARIETQGNLERLYNHLFYMDIVTGGESHAGMQRRIEEFTQRDLYPLIPQANEKTVVRVASIVHGFQYSYMRNYWDAGQIAEGPNRRLKNLEMVALAITRASEPGKLSVEEIPLVA